LHGCGEVEEKERGGGRGWVALLEGLVD